jgi:RNA polymerase sigma-70 factor (ECF subfamily)
MTAESADIEELLQRASKGEQAACGQLLERHRQRLRRMIAVRLDRRVAGRADASDVLQEALTAAAEQMPDYLRRRPLPFYPWLRQIAWQHVAQLHRRHLHAAKRSVLREASVNLGLADGSALALAIRVISGSRSSPSARLRRVELQAQVRAALLQLGERDREVLILRYLEELAPQEIAAVLGISPGAVSMRHARALLQLRNALGEVLGESEP